MIRLEEVSLTFSRNGGVRLRDRLSGLLRPGSAVALPVNVDSLQDIDLRIDRGERVGVIGLNGAGKTTLLKVMCGIYPPSRGRVTVEGEVACLLDITTGFEVEATGWQNIVTRGLLIGFTRNGIEAQIQDIADFTELGPALDRPIKTYSAGMLLRLAFAISTSLRPDVLLLDEVVAAGDQNFHEKATVRLAKMVEQASILVLVSHSMETVLTNCERALWVQAGRIHLDGPVAQVVDAYRQSVAHATVSEPSAGPQSAGESSE